MEWQLPIQKVEIGNINIGSPWSSSSRAETRREYAMKPMAPLSYFGTQFRLPFVSLLFPPLPIVEYNAATGRLVLDMYETNLASIKLNTLQDTIVNAIMYHQTGWFRSEYSKEEVRRGFQPIIQDSHLILHCPSVGVSIFNNDSWNGTMEELKPGVRIRVAVKIHGISFLNREGSASSSASQEWTGKCRLQHRILGIIMSKALSSASPSV
jgi:hypothetical protein